MQNQRRTRITPQKDKLITLVPQCGLHTSKKISLKLMGKIMYNYLHNILSPLLTFTQTSNITALKHIENYTPTLYNPSPLNTSKLPPL